MNGWEWVLTAGHCVLGANHTHKDYAYHNGTLVLQEFQSPAYEQNSYPYDFAFLNYSSDASHTTFIDSWPNQGLVLSFCRNGANDQVSGATCTFGTFTMQGRYDLNTIGIGWVVCASGSGANNQDYGGIVDTGAGRGYYPGTRCGVVTQKDGGIVTNICARRGDSGGPLFSEIDWKAYGILEGSVQSRTGPCAAGEINNYTPLTNIIQYVDSYNPDGLSFDIRPLF